MRSKYFLGIDVGGTKIAAALVDSRGRILDANTIRTNISRSTLPASVTRKQILTQIGACVEPLLKQNPRLKITATGLAAAGPLDVEKGLLVHPTHFPGWKIVPIVKLLRAELKKQKLHAPVYMQNDAMAAAMGEGWVGTAKKWTNYAVITVGTGIGTGVIHAGRPTQFKGMGGEWGHMLLSLPDLRQGAAMQGIAHTTSVEGYASATGIRARAKAAGFAGSTMEELVQAIRSGDTRWQPLFDDAGLALAQLAFNLSLGLRLEGIAFGGGLMREADLFLPALKARYAELIRHRKGFAAKLVKAKLGNDAGMVGAARLAYAASI